MYKETLRNVIKNQEPLKSGYFEDQYARAMQVQTLLQDSIYSRLIFSTPHRFHTMLQCRNGMDPGFFHFVPSNNHFKNYRCFSFAKPPQKLHTPAKLTAGTQKWTRMEDDVLVQSGDFQDVPSWELAYPVPFGTF